ncbi:MAG: hypothetical protein J6328_07445, partial [Bacilli bacterium]|nr:hypothetical protein [Bacilli bacterium]
VEETKGKKKADFPCLYRIKNKRRCAYAEEIYDRLASKLSIEKGTNLSDDYRLPFETDEVLLAKGLIKEVKNRK